MSGSESLLKSGTQLLPPVRTIYKTPLPSPLLWQTASEGAKSNDPFAFTVNKLIAIEQTVEIPAWWTNVFDVKESLPPVSVDEAMAVLDRFLHAEIGRVAAGVPLYTFHWEVLCAQNIPQRERFAVMSQLVASGFLTEASGGPVHQKSGLRWPLTVTEKGAAQIRRGRLNANLPTIARLETRLGDLKQSYPNLVSALIWLILGGGFVQLLVHLFDWFRD